MRPLLRLRAFALAEQGVSAVEFAIVLPVLLGLMLGGGQVVQYINATRKIEQIASAVGGMISQAAPPSADTTIATVNSLDLNFSYDSALLIFPYIMADSKRQNLPWRSNLKVSYAGIAFTKLSSACDGLSDQSPCYAARVVWTSSGTSSDNYRPCLLPQLPVDDSAAPTRYTLPRSVYGPGSIVAIDVTFRFIPTFGSGVLQPVTITRSTFMQPRYASQINFDSTGSTGIATSCF